MSSENIIRVSEFEKLYYHDDKPFKQKHWEVLCRYGEKVNQHGEKDFPYFRILNKGIQFTNYVGVIQAGNLTIEILPKTDKSSISAENENIDLAKDESKQQWQQALLQMLSECSLLKINAVNFANLHLRKHSILVIYLQLFLTATETLLQEGLAKNYEQQEGNRTALKGRLLFQKQLARNSTHDEKFYVRHTAYDYNHVYNRIIYTTLQLILNIGHNSNISDRANGLLALFPQTDAITVTPETFNLLSFDRKTGRYREALLIAKMLLLNYRPDITGGRENVVAILFDMNKLWEEWVYRRLKKEEARFGIIIHRQQSADFWKGEHLPMHKTIRPDIVVQKGDEMIVIDTKWKLINNMMPDDNDLKQMFVYNLYWDCSKSVLLYPANHLNLTKGSYKGFLKRGEIPNNCALLTATIFKDNLLDKDFARRVLEKILETSTKGMGENQ